MFSCSNIPRPLPEYDRFIDCDGNKLSDELLYIQLENALENQDYNDCALIRDELEKRGLPLNPPSFK